MEILLLLLRKDRGKPAFGQRRLNSEDTNKGVESYRSRARRSRKYVEVRFGFN
jgi:hypothetical protein